MEAFFPLRTSSGVLSSANDDEVAGLHARSAPDVRAADLQEESTKTCRERS